MDIARLDADLRVAEGIRYQAYRDSRGFWTGGVGHLLDQSIDWTGQRFARAVVETWLQADIAEAVKLSQELAEWTSLNTDARQNAVLELVFNMGTAKWVEFKHTRDALMAQNWQSAHDNLLVGPWHIEVGPARANRIANYILSGEFDGSGQSA